MERRTPAQMRSDSRADFSRFLARTLLDLDVTQADLADQVGVPASKVQVWCDPKRPEVPGIADIRQFPRELARRTLAWCAEGHHVAVVDELEPARGAGDHLASLHSLLREGSDVTSLYALALADGVVDARERRELIKEIREDIDALRAVLLRLEQDELAERALTAPGGRA